MNNIDPTDTPTFDTTTEVDIFDARIKLWTDALRSGEFAQTKSQLRRGDGFCCLGVACEVYRRETGKGEWKGNLFLDSDNRFSTAVLSAEVKNWLGLSEPGGLFDTDSHYGSALFSKNDHEGYDFNEIADLIESNPPALRAEGTCAAPSLNWKMPARNG